MYNINNYTYFGINPVNTYDLPICDRKSWYGKAKVVETEKEICLQSYDTLVCCFDKANKTFERLWDGYSATTQRHINCFMRHLGFMLGGKHWWESLEVNRKYTISEMLDMI